MGGVCGAPDLSTTFCGNARRAAVRGARCDRVGCCRVMPARAAQAVADGQVSVLVTLKTSFSPAQSWAQCLSRYYDYELLIPAMNSS